MGTLLQGKRTYIVALIAVVLGALEATDWTKFLADPKAGLATLVMGVLMALLRYLTQATTVQDALHAPPPERNEQ